MDLAENALLRWDSYVNLRHVYKVDWSYLKTYANPDTPSNSNYRFERESTIRMLAKGKLLTTYETGTQVQGPMTVQIPVGQHHEYADFQSPGSETASIDFSENSALSPPPQWELLGTGQNTVEYSRRPPSEPPDATYGAVRPKDICSPFQHVLEWPCAVAEGSWTEYGARSFPLI